MVILTRRPLAQAFRLIGATCRSAALPALLGLAACGGGDKQAEATATDDQAVALPSPGTDDQVAQLDKLAQDAVANGDAPTDVSSSEP